VSYECICSTNVPQLGETNLSDDCTKLATCSRHSVRGGSVTSGESFPRDDESGRVRTEVLEEVGEAVEEHESFLG
jgi:hypothetical protein